jgi:hypothetical protein
MKTISIRNNIFGLIVLGSICSCCGNWPEKHYSLQIKNNSNFDVCCYFYLVWGGGNSGVVYPDTLLFFDKNALEPIAPKGKFETSRSVEPIIEWVSSLPKDTLSIYFFSQDTLNKYSWEEIQRDYKILQRYDLSTEDIHKLKDKYDVPEIPYPPTAIMKDMKMYPPYQ